MSKKPTIAELEKKVAELTEALQRERADALNLKRRTDEERVKLAGFYKAMTVQELLPALDNLERAMKHTAKEWADEIRPGLKSPDGLIVDEDTRRGPSPLGELENRVRKFGVTSSQSLAELAFIGLDLSRKSEMEKK
jgi:hypothetical protein